MKISFAARTDNKLQARSNAGAATVSGRREWAAIRGGEFGGSENQPEFRAESGRSRPAVTARHGRLNTAFSRENAAGEAAIPYCCDFRICGISPTGF
jgi:hypothetical protein